MLGCRSSGRTHLALASRVEPSRQVAEGSDEVAGRQLGKGISSKIQPGEQRQQQVAGHMLEDAAGGRNQQAGEGIATRSSPVLAHLLGTCRVTIHQKAIGSSSRLATTVRGGAERLLSGRHSLIYTHLMGLSS